MMSDARKPTHAPPVPRRRAPKLRRLDADDLAPHPAASGVDDPSTTDHIVQSVTRAIVEHRLLPGTKLVEQKLGDLFGVSRTIVRQALHRLSELKLVQLEPARGAFVASPSLDEARQVFAVRRMIESQMLRELIARPTPADLTELHQHVQAEQDAVKRIDVSVRTKLLFDFHVKLTQLLGNQVLTDLMQELVSRCSLISLMYQSADDAETSHAEHRDILKAIEARDAEHAVQLLHDHLASVERQLIEHPRAQGLPHPQS